MPSSIGAFCRPLGDAGRRSIDPAPRATCAAVQASPGAPSMLPDVASSAMPDTCADTSCTVHCGVAGTTQVGVDSRCGDQRR